MPGISARFALDKNKREVIIVVILHWLTADAMDSLPAGEIQIDRHFAGEKNRYVDQRAGHRGGQDNPTMDCAAQ